MARIPRCEVPFGFGNFTDFPFRSVATGALNQNPRAGDRRNATTTRKGATGFGLFFLLFSIRQPEVMPVTAGTIKIGTKFRDLPVAPFNDLARFVEDLVEAHRDTVPERSAKKISISGKQIVKGGSKGA